MYMHELFPVSCDLFDVYTIQQDFKKEERDQQDFIDRLENRERMETMYCVDRQWYT